MKHAAAPSSSIKKKPRPREAAARTNIVIFILKALTGRATKSVIVFLAMRGFIRPELATKIINALGVRHA